MVRQIAFITDPRFKRRAREQQTVDLMLAMYCRAHHGQHDELCPDCAQLQDYAARRLVRCVFGDAKPTCANCLVHCYGPDPRERMRAVMRWAGPRMLLRHPILAIRHLLDGRKPAPRLPEKTSR